MPHHLLVYSVTALCRALLFLCYALVCPTTAEEAVVAVRDPAALLAPRSTEELVAAIAQLGKQEEVSPVPVLTTPTPPVYASHQMLYMKVVDFTCEWGDGKQTPKDVFESYWNSNSFWTTFDADPKPFNSSGFHGSGDSVESDRADMWGGKPKCYTYQHNMGTGNGFFIDWMLDHNQGRCDAWSRFLLSFMATHGAEAERQVFPLVKHRFVSASGTVSFFKESEKATTIDAGTRPDGSPLQTGDRYYVPAFIFVDSHGQANPYVGPSSGRTSYLNTLWRVEDTYTDHVFVKYDGKYYDPSYEHAGGASYSTINTKADHGVGKYYYNESYLCVDLGGGTLDWLRQSITPIDVWTGPSGLVNCSLVECDNVSTEDEMEEP